VTELGTFEVEERGDLLAVGGEVASDVLLGQCRPFVGSARRVTDRGGHVPDDEHHLVTHALEAAQEQHRHRVTQVHLGPGRVDAELRDEPAALPVRLDDPLGQRVGGGLKLLGAVGDQGGLLGWGQVRQVQASTLRGLGQQLTHGGVAREVAALKTGGGAANGLAESGHRTSSDTVAGHLMLSGRRERTPAGQHGFLSKAKLIRSTT